MGEEKNEISSDSKVKEKFTGEVFWGEERNEIPVDRKAK